MIRRAHLTMQKRLTLALYIEKSMKTTLVPRVIQLFCLRKVIICKLCSFDLFRMNINPPVLYRPIRPQCQGARVAEV